MNDRLRKRIRKELEKATVKIITEQGSIGTGFFISPHGYIITAYHCIENKLRPDETRFHLRFEFSDGEVRNYEVQLESAGSNKAADLAVFRIAYPPPACLPLGRIMRENINDKVVAVGYAAGHKEEREIGFYSGEISSFVGQQFETTVAIQGPGQSGGPVYHYESRRVAGLVQDVYDSKVMSNAGLALRFDSLFEEWPELDAINDKVAAAWDEKIGPETDKSEPEKPGDDVLPGKCGDLTHKLFNRHDEKYAFWSFFAEIVRECPTRPQFYFIHGDRGQGHESFIERMIEEHIKKYVKKHWRKEDGAVCLEEVRWPDRGDLQMRKRSLEWGTFMTFDPSYDKACSLTELQQLCCNHQFVALYHRIDVSKWKPMDEDLLRWYMGEKFWAGFECSGDIPRFLIFFNIMYPASGFFRVMAAIKRIFGCYCFSKERIVTLTGETAQNKCPCLPEIELLPVQLKDLEDWFSKYKPCVKKSDPKLIRSIFKKCRNYEEIEQELKQIIRKAVDG